jgi:hypothetical protein
VIQGGKKGKNMRSDLVFVATGRVRNRFLLCHSVRVSSRKFHKNGIAIQETINKVFGLVTEQVYRDASIATRAEWESSFSLRNEANRSRTFYNVAYEDEVEKAS